MSGIEAVITLVGKNEIRAVDADGRLYRSPWVKTVVGITHGEDLRTDDRVILRVDEGKILSAVKIG